MKNVKGFTLIELLAVIVILAIIALIATPVITKLIDNARRESFKSSSYGIIDSVETGFAKQLLTKENPALTKYEYVEGEETKTQGNINITYTGKKPENGILLIDEVGKTAIFFYENDACAIKKFEDTEIVIEEITKDECLNNGTSYMYFDEIKGVNRPQLVTGMTPIKWNGTAWESTNIADPEWYDYSQKKWANVKTADGSMWVWIPRYIYKISSGWHTNVGSMIDIQFTKGTNDDWNSGVIGNIDTGTTSNASNNKWTNHPAFTFGTDEVTGIWVAKFQPSVEGTTCYGSNVKADCDKTTLVPKSLPNKSIWRFASPGSYFTVGRSLETNPAFGWGDSGTGIDTHMIKNIEWGAVAYLSSSNYGKNTEVWTNNAWPWTTGCAGNSVSAESVEGCQNTYETVNGQEASTTGTLYGVYDMVGAATEFTAAYLNNGTANLNNYGPIIVSAATKYKDVYTIGATDSSANNYAATINKKGDALYETSRATGDWSGAWYESEAYMMRTDRPWLWRGGERGDDEGSGIFAFNGDTGNWDTGWWSTSRFVIIVGEGL